MAARKHDGAKAPGPVTPASLASDARSDEAPAGDAARGFRENKGTGDEGHSASAPHSAHALRVLEGERKAREYLARLHAEQADPDELALIVAMLYGATLRGFCSAIMKAIHTAARGAR